MFKKIMLGVTAVCVAALVSCTDYGVDVAKEYKDFFDYSFDGKYSIEQTEKNTYKKYDEENNKSYNEGEKGKGFRKWDLKYTDKNGDEHTMALCGDGSVSKANHDSAVLSAVEYEKELIAYKEFYNKYQKNYIPVDEANEINNFEHTGSYHGDGYSVMCIITNEEAYVKGYDEDYVKDRLSSKKGLKVTDCDLKSFLSEKTTAVTLAVIINKDDKISDVASKVLNMKKELMEKEPELQNYYILVSYDDEEYEELDQVVYKEAVIFGEDVELTEDEDYSEAFKKKLEEKS